MKTLVLLFAILISSLALSPFERRFFGLDIKDTLKPQVPKDEDKLNPVERFFMIGDFGDLESHEDLLHVTDTMNSLATKQKYDFIGTVGDNIYHDGIVSMEDLDDANQIMKSFEKKSIKNLPMYLTLGNHDWYSDYKNEIKYSEFNKMWNMPDEYYDLKFPMQDDPTKSMVLIMANSCLLPCLNVVGEDAENSKKNWAKMNVEVGEARVKEHYDWLESKLAQYKKDPNVAWLGIVMHHPIFVEPSIKIDLLPMLRDYKVDFAFVGHKHIFEYATMDWDYELRFPTKETGEVLDDCKDKTEIITSSERVQIFKKGQTLHQFMIGGSGREFLDICPYKDQDGQVFYQSVKEHSIMTVEVSSKRLTAKYHEGPNDVAYEVIINA